MTERFLICCLLFFFSCASSNKGQKTAENQGLRFLSAYVVPYNQQFENTTIGGLSGIDYNPEKKEYYLISDDRSEKNPARFYTAAITLNKNKIDTVIFLKKTFLKNQMGNFYPNSLRNPFETPDPEALRYNRTNNTFIWTSEGERIVNGEKTVLENPAITEIKPDGQFIDTFQLPPQLIMHSNENGPRQNGVFEGLTFSGDYKSLFVSVEEPLYQDGPRAGTGDSTGMVRIIAFDTKTKKPVAQYAYKIDPVAHPAITPSSFKINGISDIISFDKNKLLVIERSYSTGRLSCAIKIFEADISTGENINDVASLKDKEVKVVSKKLLLNMDDLGIYVDNIEGVTFGPTLPNGKRSLLFVADNNFNPLEQTQFLLFEME